MRVRVFVMWLGVVAALVGVPAVVEAGSGGPRFTGQFKPEYDAGAPIDVSGEGCPATGGPPSATPPGVFVGPTAPGDLDVLAAGVEVTVENGQVVFTPEDSFWTGIYSAIYFPVAADGTWSGVMPHGLEAGGGAKAIVGLCTTLLRLTEDGSAIDPASLEDALFISPEFVVSVILIPPGFEEPPSTTTAVPPPAVRAEPAFTG